MKYDKNDILTVTIEDIGHDGEGIGKVDGYTLFVKDALIGDVVEVSIMKAKKNYAYAKLKKVVTPSSFRVEPRCAFHRQCGGCQLQTLAYEKQLEFKQDKISNHLVRIGGFDPELVSGIMEPIVGMSAQAGEAAYRYRNKALYPVGKDKMGKAITGFYAGRTHTIIANTDCLLGAEGNKEILEAVLTYINENEISVYDENSGTGLIRHILIRTGRYSGEVMVCLVINREAEAGGMRRTPHPDSDLSGNHIAADGAEVWLPRQQDLIDRLRGIKDMTSILVNLNSARTNVVMGKEVRLLWGKERISDTIRIREAGNDFALTGKEITFQISALSFFQVNPIQTEKLYSLVLDYAGLAGRETVWDLYCGIGTISLFLAVRAGQVWGVETVAAAVRDGEMNARVNGIDNVRFFLGKAEEVLPAKYREEGMYADVIVVDPPRKGCDEACLKTMLAMKPERIVYVSCDSATLARDLRVLCDGGYCVKKVRGVDQFSQSVHVETVVQLSRKKGTPKIEVKMDVQDGDIPELKNPTYKRIQGYVMDKYGVHVHSRYIAEVKRMCGIEMGENYNKSKKDEPDVKHCPAEKVEYIKEALRYYGITN